MKYLIISGLASLCLATAQARTWTSKKGTTVEAEIVSVTGDQVTIKMDKGGRKITFSKNTLSAADQEFVEDWDPPAAQNSALNFDDPWPVRVELTAPPEIEVVEENPDENRFVYHSEHYKFVCDVRLNVSLVRKFARLFEVSFQAMVELPLSFTKARSFDSDQRLRIELFETKESYVRNGGPPSSAGVYMGGRNVVMVPLTSLGVRPLGSGYIIDRDVSNKTLVHELTHQLTDHAYYAHGARGWFTEGLAEYVATSPYSSSGKINFKSNIKAIKEYATGFSRKFGSGRNLGTEISMPDLKKYMLQPYREFTGGQANYNYGMGLVLFTWFAHMDDNGSGKNLIEFMKAMRAGKKGEELLEVMKAGRSWDELKADIAKGWRSKGVKIEFGKGEY